MASIRINFHRSPNPRDATRKFLADKLITKQRVFWDKTSHGISLCVGKDWEQEHQRYYERFVEIKNELDLDEVFRHYEDEE